MREVTMARPICGTVRAGEISQAFVEWHKDREGAGPTLLMTHATGFHARMWDEIAIHLPEYHIIAVDQRGHGDSGGEPVENWSVFGDDLVALIKDLNLTNIVGVGHSMGGHATIDAAAKVQDRFRRIIAIDPVVAPPEAYEVAPVQSVSTADMNPASKRKEFFASPEEMFERFVDRTPYKVFTKTMLANYCTYGLKPADGGGYRLACAPEMEASIYMTSRSNKRIFQSIKSIDMPVIIVRARAPDKTSERDFSLSPTWPKLSEQFLEGRDLHLADRTHFIPMEIPEYVASLIHREATS